VNTLLAQFDIFVEYNNWTSKDKACCFAGIAGQLIWDSGQPDMLTFGELSASGHVISRKKSNQNYVHDLHVGANYWRSYQ